MKKSLFTDYKKCLEYLFALERAGIKYNLNNIKKLCKLSGNPEKYFKSIHIAGTNGKGSTASIINSVLIEKGFKTGLYSSPHISDFRERITVNGKFIGRKFILDFVNSMHDEIEKIKPSFFEVTTALAFSYFHFMKTDYAVIETGLGGRLDSTNILKPLVSVITSIGIDHVEFLGKKLESIAAEKAGIIKENTPVVIGRIPDKVKPVFKKIASENKSRIYFSEKRFKSEIIRRSEKGFEFKISEGKNKSLKFFFPVTGDYQIFNIKTSITALQILGKTDKIDFSNSDFEKAFKNLRINSRLYGRFDLISDSPKIVTDVSHNIQAIQNLRSNLKYFKYNKLYVIFAMMSDKEFAGSLNELLKLKAAKIILTKPEYKRSAIPEVLLKSVKKKKSMFEINYSIKDSYEKLMNIAGKKDLILVTGSFFLVSDFLKVYKPERS